jgi:hypothetical protein
VVMCSGRAFYGEYPIDKALLYVSLVRACSMYVL